MKNSTTIDVDATNVHNQPLTLNERIAAVKAHVRGLPSARNLTDDQLFIACRSALERMSDLVSVGDPSMRSTIEHWEREIVPCLTIDHWMCRFAKTVKIPLLNRLNSSGIPFDDADVEEVTNSFWILMISRGLRTGEVRSLGNGKNLTKGISLYDIPDCDCLSECECHLGRKLHAAQNLPGLFFRLARKAGESWRTKHRSRNQDAANAKRDAKIKAAQQGIVYVEPPKVDPSEIVWAVRKPNNLGNLDSYGQAKLTVVDDDGMQKRNLKGSVKSHVVKLKQDTRWADACSVRKRYHFTDATADDRAALNDWRRLPHNIVQATPEQWKALMDHPPVAVFAPDQITSRGQDTIITSSAHLYHCDYGRVKLIRHLGDGRTWIEIKGQPVQVDTADLHENKWTKPKQVRKQQAVAVA